MRHAYKALAGAAALCLAIGAAPVPVAAEPVGFGQVVLKFSGDYGWSVDCRFEQGDGDTIRRTAKGRGDVETFAVKSVANGSCDYKVSDRGPLSVTFENQNDPDACPFDVGDARMCKVRFTTGHEGTFRF
jgi:hypothetical protein